MRVLIISTLYATCAFANLAKASTTVSNIKDETVVCFHVSKQDALVFKTTPPYKVWKSNQDKAGLLKKKNALELSSLKLDLVDNYDKDTPVLPKKFQAHITKEYILNGLFENLEQGISHLTVTSTYLPDTGKSNIVDHYNCHFVLAN